MAKTELLEDEVQLCLRAVCGPCGLAADVLVNRFGLPRPNTEGILERGYGLLAPRMAAAEARAAVPLLAALGLRVVIQPVEALPPDEFCDLSIRVQNPKITNRLMARLDKLLGLPDLTPVSFNGPAGLVLTGLSPARAEWLCDALRPLTGAQTTISDHHSALYDLFAPSGLTEDEDLAVRRYLSLVGAVPGGFGDAVGTGLERRVLDRVLARFKTYDLVGVNQAFQRHDLLIIGKGSLIVTEFVDFLMTRPAAQCIPMRKLMEALPLKLEGSLTRTRARQFLSDYSAIGMQAVTRLVWAPHTLAGNP